MRKKKNLLTSDDVKHLAKLANLQLTAEELIKYQKQLEETIEYVNNLQELDTTNVDVASTSIASRNVYFADGDKNIRSLSESQAFRNSKIKKNGYFVVRRIL